MIVLFIIIYESDSKYSRNVNEYGEKMNSCSCMKKIMDAVDFKGKK